VRRWIRAASLIVVGALASTAFGQAVNEFPVPAPKSGVLGIAAGPDGNLWFTERDGNKIGRITTLGAITEFALPTAGSMPGAIVAGPDGNLWFTEQGRAVIGRITTAGSITEFEVTRSPGDSIYGVQAIAAGPDGNLWFTVPFLHGIGWISTAGVATLFTIPVLPDGITAGPDGNLWFTTYFGTSIGRITPAGGFTEFRLSGNEFISNGIVAGSDGNLWFTRFGGIGRITTSGSVTEFTVPTPFNTGTRPTGIVEGPDGNIWYTEYEYGTICCWSTQARMGSLSRAGAVRELTVPAYPADSFAIVVGPDGNLWFPEIQKNMIGRLAIKADPRARAVRH
jgi:streptogramin lyase